MTPLAKIEANLHRYYNHSLSSHFNLKHCNNFRVQIQTKLHQILFIIILVRFIADFLVVMEKIFKFQKFFSEEIMYIFL